MELQIAIVGEGAHVDTVPLRMITRLTAAYLSALRAIADINEFDMADPTGRGAVVREGSSRMVVPGDSSTSRAAELLHAALLGPTVAPELRKHLQPLADAARGLRPGWVAVAAWGTRGDVQIPDKVPPAPRLAEITVRPTRITGHNRERGPKDTPVIYATDTLRDINYIVETDAGTAMKSVEWERPGIEVCLRMKLTYGTDERVARAELLEVDAVCESWSVAETMAWFGEEFGIA